MKITLTFLSALLLALLAVNGSRPVYAADETATKKSVGTTDRAELVIDADTVFEVNGVSIVPDGLFGVTAYNGPETATDERWRALLIDSGLRWVGMLGNPGWLLPPEAPPGFGSGWADTPTGAAFLDHRRGGYHIPTCLKAWRDIGIEPMLYLGFQGIFRWPDSGDGKPRPEAMPPTFPLTPQDIERAAVEWGEYVALLKRVDPGLTWVHLENEPNAHWFRFGKGGADYAAILKEVAKGIKTRNPGVKVGGPVLCWPPSFPPNQKGCASWYTWDSYTMPLIETAGEELDFFDFHLYGGTSTLGMEEVQTVANAMWLKTGRRNPVMISEYGAYLTDDDRRSVERVWELRIAPWQRQVMDFLDVQPDKVISLQSHDLLAQAGGNFRVFKGLDPDDQFAFAKMYRTWAPLKGRRLLASSPDPAVRVFAARNDCVLSGKGRLALLLVNSSDQVKNVTVRVEGAPDNPPIDATVPVNGLYIRPMDCVWQGTAAATPTAAEGIQRTDLGGAVGGTNDGPVAASADAGPSSATKRAAAPAADRARVESGTFLCDRPVYAFTLAPRETRSVEYALTKAAPPTEKNSRLPGYRDVLFSGPTVGLSAPHISHPAIPGGEPPSVAEQQRLFERSLDQAAEIVGTDLALVRVYVDWSEVEPLPGLYCSDALDQRLALARAKGVRVVVALGAGAPPWLPHESMRGQYGLERHGTLQKWGYHAAGRLASVWAPVYGHGAATAFEALSRRLAANPAVAGYHTHTTEAVWDAHGTISDYSPWARRAFAAFLRDRRGLSLEDVNTRYGTAWQSWDEVQLPQAGLPQDGSDLSPAWRDFSAFKQQSVRHGLFDLCVNVLRELGDPRPVSFYHENFGGNVDEYWSDCARLGAVPMGGVGNASTGEYMHHVRAAIYGGVYSHEPHSAYFHTSGQNALHIAGDVLSGAFTIGGYGGKVFFYYHPRQVADNPELWKLVAGHLLALRERGASRLPPFDLAIYLPCNHDRFGGRSFGSYPHMGMCLAWEAMHREPLLPGILTRFAPSEAWAGLKLVCVEDCGMDRAEIERLTRQVREGGKLFLSSEEGRRVLDEPAAEDFALLRAFGFPENHGLDYDSKGPAELALRPPFFADRKTLHLRTGAAKVAAFQPLPGAGPAMDGSRAGWEGCAPVVFGDDAARIEVRCGYNPETLFLRWEVRAAQPTAVPPLPSPERIFTHDRVATTLGFYLQGDAAARGKAAEGRPGDTRIVFGLHDDNGQVRPAALGLYPRWDGPGEARPFLHISPGQRTPFAHVALLGAVKLAHTLSDDRKTLVLTAAIPRSVLPGTVPGLAGGWRSMANFDANIGGSHKLWWSNADGSASRETKDEPTEARLYPGVWGQAAFTPLSGGLPIRAWLVNGPWRAEALKYTGTPENKRQFQQHFDTATFPPDSRTIGSGDIASQAPAKPGQWKVLNARPIDNCLYPDDGLGLYARGCNLYFAANWIWAPETMEVTLELPMQHQNNLRVWLNGTRLAETAREQGLYRTVNTPQKITLQAGWNPLFLRAYALGYDLHFGAVLKADAGQLWRLRLSARPPQR